jgi:hypothetical protein
VHTLTQVSLISRSICIAASWKYQKENPWCGHDKAWAQLILPNSFLFTRINFVPCSRLLCVRKVTTFFPRVCADWQLTRSSFLRSLLPPTWIRGDLWRSSSQNKPEKKEIGNFSGYNFVGWPISKNSKELLYLKTYPVIALVRHSEFENLANSVELIKF